MTKRTRRTTAHAHYLLMQKRSTKQRAPVTGPTIIILGPQGSGKGTQADLLVEKYKFAHLETGAMLRQEERRHTPFGKRIAAYIDQGKLVPFTWALHLLAQKLQTIPHRRGIVIDGSPRRLPEALRLIRLLHEAHRDVAVVLLINISHKESIRRLSKRWMCTRHKHILTMGVDIHKPSDRCPRCQSGIEQREDDQPRAIAQRLAIFQRDTTPVIRYFQKEHLLVTLHGEQSVPAVFRAVDRVVRQHITHG